MRPIDGLLIGLVMAAAAGRAVADDEPGPNRADEPLAERATPAAAARFLDRVALDWTRARKCGTCHTNFAYLLARPAFAGGDPAAMAEVRSFFEGRVANWDGPGEGDAPRWDTEVVATAVALAVHDSRTTGRLHDLTRRALDRMWRLQRADGAWDWLKCDWPPLEHDDDFGAAMAAVGVAHAPAEYRESAAARAGIEKLLSYLREHPATSLHHRAWRLWAATRLDGIMTGGERAETVAELRRRQRPDGGWNLASLGDWSRHDGSPNDPDGPSDGYGTGFVVFVLRRAGVPADDPAVARGVGWLRANQRQSGRWFTRSPSTDKAHYITHAGTAFALLALQEAAGVDPPPAEEGGASR